MRRTPTPTRRDGFTLVELLVVITIIAILVSLTAAAVVKVIGKGDEARVRNEISQLNAAVQAFKTDFNVPYLPSRLTLPPTGAVNDAESAQFISKLWPRINPQYMNTPAKWNLSSQVTLVGHQTIVFFLAGARDPSGAPIGFSASPTEPMELTSTTRKGPYYEFTLDRLKAVVAGNPFPSFMDVYGTAPYIYFSSRNAGNDYYAPTNPVNDVQFAVGPYQTTATRYANPTGFQIICAGKDGQFGTPGGLAWAGATGGGATATGADDMANFYPTLLGISQ